MKVDATNNTDGTLTGYDCAKCKNKGYFAFIDENGTARYAKCSCMAVRSSIRRIEQSGLSDMLEKCKLITYSTDRDWQKQVKAAAENYLSKGRGKWFMISGTPGTGKTHICTAICGEILDRGLSVRYMIWRKDGPKLKALIGERDRYEKLMQEFADADVLYIDDFLKGSVSDADVNLAFELLNSRYINRKAAGTIISSELTIEQILNIDEGLGSRIAERADGFMILTPKENLRLQKASGK